MGLALCVLSAYAELVQLKRDWLPAATGAESLQFSIPFPTPHEFALALAGDIRVDWNGSLIPTYATIDKQATYITLLLEFTVPPELRRPGVVDFTLWDAANQRQLAYRGRVTVAIPTAAKIYEADPASDRVVAYVPNGEAPDGGRVDVYSLMSGALVETIPLFAPQQVLAFTPDTTFAWIVENLNQGRVARLNLRSRQLDQTIQITAGNPPFSLIQAQVDRLDPNLLMVFASSPGEESAQLEVHRLVAEAGAIAVDMETSAIAAACARRGVPWTAFRGISDRTYDGFIDDHVMALTRPDGSTDGRAVAKLLTRRPWVIPRLTRLARGTSAATRVAAAATVAACRAWASA
jgi:hypothetical protein